MFDEMNKQPGNEPQEARWEGWTPPWMSGEEQQGPQGPRGPFGGFGPRGWRGPRGPFGPFGPGRGFGPGGPQEWQGPRGPFGHGHHGHHGPRGFGFGFGFGPGRWQGIPDEMLALRAQAAEVARLFAIAGRGAFENKERLAELRAMLDRTHKELTDMIYGSGQSQQSQESQPTGESQTTGNTPDVGQA